jgi:redox-sensitive bicupin YhaK (pirin superfamily)
MTAGAGIVHEEFHSQQFTEQGGLLKMVQLWVNLPASAKDTPAAYQTLLNKDIPRVSLEDDGGTLRVIAGEYLEHKGPARTFTPINVWDLKLEPGARVNLPVPKGHTTLVAVLNGSVQINDTDVLREAELANLDREGQEIVLESNNDARLLVLSGEPIDEPVVGYGPFVMNTEGEIKQAMLDFQSGKFGAL